MPNLDELQSLLTAYTEAIDRITDRIAETKDHQVKAVLIKQYDELKKLILNIEVQVRELEKSKI